MIMGIENSGMTITADAIKTKILQDVKDAKCGKNISHQTAFLVKKNKRDLNLRCYNCNKRDHFANRCFFKERRSKLDKGEASDKMNRQTKKRLL